MEPVRTYIKNRKILAILLTLFLVAGMFCPGSPPAYAKGSLSPDDYVKNVLVYAKNSAGDEVLISQLNVSDMLDYLNDNLETYGRVHNYSILDKYVTPVHQEAQGFMVHELLDYAMSRSTLANIDELGLSFSGQDSVAFWEIDGNGFDAIDTYTCDDLYGVERYNFPALYANWDYTAQEYVYGKKDAIWSSRQAEQALLSITAYSQRYIVSPLYGTSEYNMENYFDGQGLLDTARTVRLMLPMTESEFKNRISTANNSRYGICYILFDPAARPDFSLGEVARPTYAVIDGDASANDDYDAGYWYFTLSCSTEGASIYYNDNSLSSYMPTALYTPGQAIKMKKNGTTPVTLKFRAVKEGCSDAGIQTASSDQSPEEAQISFTLTPADAAVTVKNSGGATRAANPDGTYTLIAGETYTYQVTAPGYVTKSGSFTAAGGENIEVALTRAGEEAAVSFTLTPADAAVTVKDSGGGTMSANPDGAYTLITGETYNYQVTAAGHITQSGSFTVTGAENINIVLNKEQIATDGPNQIVLSWTDDPSTSQTVVWNDNSGRSEVVQYAVEAGYTDESSFSSAGQTAAAFKTVGYGENAKTYYEATISGLTSGTKYYYRVGSDDEWSDVCTFTTAPSTASSFSFMYLGDVQYNTTAAAEYPVWGSLLSGAYAAHPDVAFGLMGGDMVNSGIDMNDWTHFLSYASPVFGKIPLMTTIGNHESNFPGGKAQFYKDILALPDNGPAGFEEEFYSFDYGTVHVTALNSWALSSEQNLDAEQKKAVSDWISSDLAGAQDAKFRIVMIHHPAYSLAADTVCSAVLADWAPLLEAGRVDLVLCGHQHVYTRSYPMRAGGIDYDNGITYVMGNSGQKFYSTADTSYQEKTIFSKSTYQVLRVNGDTLSLSSYDSAGNLVDSWSTTAKITTLTGDVDSDGDVDMDDVDAVCRAVLNSSDYDGIMDVNGDGTVDMRDAQLVLKIYLNKAA